MRRIDEISGLFRIGRARSAVILLAGLFLSSCATAYGERGSSVEAPFKDLATLGGMATEVPEAKDFVRENRTGNLDYIPLDPKPDTATAKRKPLTEDEILLLKKKLEAAQRQNNAVPVGE